MNAPVRDSRYRTARILIESGKITNIKEILKHVPPSVVAKDMHADYCRTLNLFSNPGQFTMEEMHQLADIIDCDFKLIFDILSNEVIKINVAEDK